MDDIKQRLKEACNGHPVAEIPWPHRLLHTAADYIEQLENALEARRMVYAVQVRKLEERELELQDTILRLSTEVCERGHSIAELKKVAAAVVAHINIRGRERVYSRELLEKVDALSGVLGVGNE